MRTISMRELNRRTAQILDAVETGATFELLRNGKAIGYLTPTPPVLERSPDWDGHFAWLKKQKAKGGGFVQELEAERRRGRAREQAMGEHCRRKVWPGGSPGHCVQAGTIWCWSRRRS